MRPSCCVGGLLLLDPLRANLLECLPDASDASRFILLALPSEPRARGGCTSRSSAFREIALAELDVDQAVLLIRAKLGRCLV